MSRVLVPVRVCLCLVAGTVVTVAVVWSAALLAPGYPSSGRTTTTPAAGWPVPVPASFPAPQQQAAVRGTIITQRHWSWNALSKNNRCIIMWEFGWPFRALRCVQVRSSCHEDQRDERLGFLDVPPELDALLSLSGGPGHMPSHRALPYLPCWPGLLGDVAFFSAVMWLLAMAPSRAIRWVRRRFAHRPGLCPRCEYPIGVSPVCTECGHSLTAVG